MRGQAGPADAMLSLFGNVAVLPSLGVSVPMLFYWC